MFLFSFLQNSRLLSTLSRLFRNLKLRTIKKFSFIGLNKAKFFDVGLAKNLVTAAKVILILVDFNQKMDEIFMDMRMLFEGLEVDSLVPLDQVPNISINTEELPMLQGWGPGATGQTPTPTKPATTPELIPQDVHERSGPAE